MTHQMESSARIGPTRAHRPHRILGTLLMVLLPCLVVARIACADDELTHWDKSFLVSAIESDNAEIKASEIALQQSSSADVKNFARKMIDGHQKTLAQLKTLAAKKGVDAPAAPGLAQRTKIDVLGKLSGASFDKHYADTIGVSAHEDAVKLFQGADKKSRDADLKQFAAATLPTLQSHLAMANDLKSRTDNEK